MPALLCAVFCLSGASALLFENLWFQRAGLALGNSVWASSLVLAAFMGGLALGNAVAGRVGHRAKRPARLYAALELVIGATGLAIVLGLPVRGCPARRPAAAAGRPAGPRERGAAGRRVHAAARAGDRDGRDAAAPRPRAGTRRPAVRPRARPALRVEHARRARRRARGRARAVPLARPSRHRVLRGGPEPRRGGEARSSSRAAPSASAAAEPPRGEPAPLVPAAYAILAAAFASGGVLLALEVVWFRFLVLFTLPGSLAFALMLTVVLLGIGGGGLLGARALLASRAAARASPLLLAAAAVITVATYASFDAVVARVSSDARTELWGIAALGLALMLPTSLLSGALFTWLGEALFESEGSETRSAGLLAFANTTGAMLGALAAGFVLLPRLGIERSIQLLAGVYVVAAAGSRRPRYGRAGAGRRLRSPASSPRARSPSSRSSRAARSRRASSPSRSMPSPPAAARRSPRSARRSPRRSSTCAPRCSASRATTASSRTATRCRERCSSRNATCGSSCGSRSPFHPRPRSALLISYGVGTTAKALVDTRELETIDVVDVSRDVLELNRIVWDDPADYPLADPRVRVHIEDGRQFLQTTAQRFDLITGEPPPPKNAGIVSLYTREFFALVRDRLEEGGIASYWLPVHTFETRRGVRRGARLLRRLPGLLALERRDARLDPDRDARREGPRLARALRGAVARPEGGADAARPRRRAPRAPGHALPGRPGRSGGAGGRYAAPRRRLAEAARRPGREHRARRGALAPLARPRRCSASASRGAGSSRGRSPPTCAPPRSRGSSAAASSTTRSRTPTRGCAARPQRSRTRTAR